MQHQPETPPPSAPRLALFTFDLEGGGAERVMATLANGFARAGFPVDLVCVRASGPFLREVDPAVRIVDLAARKTMLAAMLLARYLRTERPAALLSTLIHVNIVAAAARRVARIPLRFVARETTHPSLDNQTLWGGEHGPVARLRGWAYRSADRIVAPSRGVAEDLIAHAGVAADRVSIVSNPLDLDRIDRLGREPAPHLAGRPDGLRTVVSVGRLSEEKDLPTLLRAFARVRARRGDVTLLLLGEGGERDRLRRLASELGIEPAVLMPGFVDNPFAYLTRASVFVLSSRYEGMPNTLLQALATGTAAVSTDCPSGPREILEHGKWGRLVPVGDGQAMAEAITDALEGRVACPPRAEVARRFGLEAIVEEYRKILFDR